MSAQSPTLSPAFDLDSTACGRVQEAAARAAQALSSGLARTPGDSAEHPRGRTRGDWPGAAEAAPGRGESNGAGILASNGASAATSNGAGTPGAVVRAPGAGASIAANGATAGAEGTPDGGDGAVGGLRLYKGRSTAELIPKIQAELGPEAIVIRRRSGLEGGIGGFFQRPFVEIEAQPGNHHIDVRDGEDALPPIADAASTALGHADDHGAAHAQATSPVPLTLAHLLAREGGSAAPGEAELTNGFADALAGATAARGAAEPALSSFTAAAGSLAPSLQRPASLEAGDPAHAPAARSRTQATLLAELLSRGFDEAFAAGLLDAATAHVLPFAPRGGLRAAVRVALEAALPQAAPLPGGGAAIVLVGTGGAGKSTCVKALAACYERGSMRVGCASLMAVEAGRLAIASPPAIPVALEADSKQARELLRGARAGGVALLDTPSLSPADATGIRTLARLLDELAPERVVVALPATLSAAAAAHLLRAMKPLKANALAITHADESDQLGVAVQAACEFGLAPEYLLAGSRPERALRRIDPSTLTNTLLP